MFAILCKHNQVIYDLDTSSKKKRAHSPYKYIIQYTFDSINFTTYSGQ